MSDVIYVVHPVPAELKAKLRKEGKKILDAVFAAEGDEVLNPHAEVAEGDEEKPKRGSK
jgi:hypothetical protein